VAYRTRVLPTRNVEEAKIIILGRGFAGLYAAMYLDKKLARRPDVDVTLITGGRARLRYT
jgi:NADH dehydrogenase FAD-containing subunit